MHLRKKADSSFLLIISCIILVQICSTTLLILFNNYGHKLATLDNLLNQQLISITALRNMSYLTVYESTNSRKVNSDQQLEYIENIKTRFNENQKDILSLVSTHTFIQSYVEEKKFTKEYQSSIYESDSLWNSILDISKQIISKVKYKVPTDLYNNFEKETTNLLISIDYSHQIILKVKLKLSKMISILQVVAPIISIVLVIILAFIMYHSLFVPIKAQRAQLRSLIQVMSHDISNPLTVLQLQILRAKTNGFNDKVVASIEKSLNIINEIIRHVREYQAIESNKINIQLTPVNLAAVLEDIDFIFKDRLKEKNISLITNIGKFPNLEVKAAESILANQILNNLVSNAIKFTHEGGEVSILIQEQGDKVIINIADNGVGIPSVLIKDVFRPDKSTSRAGTKGEKGTGFGLPLVKKYVESFKGKISVKSTTASQDPSNSGTTFTLVLKKA